MRLPARSFDPGPSMTPCRKRGLGVLAFALLNYGPLLRLRVWASRQLFQLSYGDDLRRDEPQHRRLYALSFQLGRTWLCGDDHLIPDVGESAVEFKARLARRGHQGHSRYQGPLADFQGA